MNYNHWIFKIWPLSNYAAITLPWGVYYKGIPSNSLIRHELKHIEQKKKLGTIKFYSLYIKEFVINLVKLKSWKAAYFNISFEIEARNAE